MWPPVQLVVGILYTALLVRVLYGVMRLLGLSELRDDQSRVPGHQAHTASATQPNDHLTTPSGSLRAVGAEESSQARQAWTAISWESINLRVGPNYKKNKKKAPTARPLLQTVHVDAASSEWKVYTDGDADIACLPPEVAAAASERTPPLRASTGSSPPPPLPRYLVIAVHIPQYSSGASDGPNVRFYYTLAVPPELRKEPG